jgi:hypothetical protein
MMALSDTTNNSVRKMSRLVELKCVKSECSVRDRFRQSVIDEQERLRLSKVTGITDEDLLLRLFNAGFRAETIASLQLFPIAMVAWASGSVSEDERRAAGQAVFGKDASSGAEAASLFESWLTARPREALWRLWEDFVHAHSAVVDRPTREAGGREVWQVAMQVAKASGGFLGFGAVCSAQRDILNRIARAYELH